ncbi:MAG TPA: hypothetical protein VHF06_15120 [Pseudonocardiaceae bacterium]|jgi:hypothetical protein|nr:hypothetical protein [Pseudonocardiaceae bacterium]
MTTPSDPNGYGQQGLPNFPAAPPPMEQPQARFTPPNEIQAAFWCYLAAAIVGLIGALMLFGSREQLLDTLRASNTALTEDQLNSVVSITIGSVVAVAVVFAALYGLFAFKLRAGRNWARIVLTIVAALALLSLLIGGAGTSVLRLVGDLAAIAGAVLSYMPNSNAYINAVKQSGV